MNPEETRTGDRNGALAYMMKNDAEEHAVVALLQQRGMSRRTHRTWHCGGVPRYASVQVNPASTFSSATGSNGFTR